MTDTQRFDQVAGTWDDDPGRVALARAIADAIGREVGLSPSMDVLDFGTGTGLLALAVQPHVRSVTGADTSAGMLEVFVRDVHHLGFDRADLRARLAAAGFEDLRETTAFVHHRQGREYSVFLISGRAIPAGR